VRFGSNGTDHASCPVGGLGVSCVETSSSATAALDKLLFTNKIMYESLKHNMNIVGHAVE
jgi:hypothetical protein